ncbi:MAG: 30S ribosomal protein S8 [Candidatus Levyibacteriota bacterium]|nr:MAG: 30S ribosomal protein S8 [Candidatus Levybacteria bacterium]
MNYQIGDFVIRLKNVCLARRKTVELPYSKLNKGVGEILVKNGFLGSIAEEERDGKKVLTATIKYEKRKPMITDVLLASKPSLRIYIKAKNVEKKKGKLGIEIISTSAGVMTMRQAKKQGIGGELLFRIW